VGDFLELVFIGAFHAVASIVGDNGEKSRFRKCLKITGVVIVALPFAAMGLYMLVD
jgi:hypothetical protein